MAKRLLTASGGPKLSHFAPYRSVPFSVDISMKTVSPNGIACCLVSGDEASADCQANEQLAKALLSSLLIDRQAVSAAAAPQPPCHDVEDRDSMLPRMRALWPG
eukprot:TRINITY_DN102478_c0_g1_i1.p1 TRINITY_DN102478_c0_g1~~TRINITY_DN102478_c0_g1_i1.p1  ORF type:complete len:104 (+),score=17.85 TRINITY_DN102478_c0_g1_i1:68-379(+)